MVFSYDSNKMFQIKKFQIKCRTISLSRLKDEFIKFQIKAVNSLQMLYCGTTVKTLNIGTPRPATVVVLNIKQFNFTMK